MLAAIVVEGLAIGLLALLVAGLLRSHAEILRALHRLGVDLDPGRAGSAPAPPAGPAGEAPPVVALTGVSPEGEAVQVALAGSGGDLLLAFLSSGCRTCAPFWTALRTGAPPPGGASAVVVVRGEEDPGRIRALAGPEVAVVMSTPAWSAFAVPGSPHFAWIAAGTGAVRGEGTAGSWEQLHSLATQAGADRSRPLHVHPAGARDNAARVDAELSAAGIGPGHPSLYPAERPPGGTP